jgi:serine/threonine protein kinase/tetratricopeptide (TPR) repeat protein
MAVSVADLKSIFGKAVELSSASARAAYLEEACHGDSRLRAEVESLLKARVDAGAFLAGPGANLTTTLDEAIIERPGTVIGPYKLLEQIGEGGMGLVFVAEQQHPVRRKVALKVIKPGMDTRQVVARFETERQALALMDHPNIAKVLDGGETASGRPYFIMELVKGVPITQFCDDNRLTTRERLVLFLPVCEAVQHAHQKGIIHRDIKPSNVLVASHDGQPVVRVIDFGVAKAVGQQLTDKTISTQLAQLIGTPLYMSPEQAGQSSLDIDTRTDIYSLGVLLYEQLTGTTPFDRARFQTASYDEIRRIFREEEPARPSTRISTLGEAAATVSASRQSDPKKLSRVLRRELDWIVMKALEKDRNRRYETASAFAADVQRYLNDEPVLACPPSVNYRLRKFALRNRGRLATAGLLGFALLVALGGLGWAALDRASREAKAVNDVELAVDRVEFFQGQGKRAEALAALDRAELLAGDCPADPARDARLAALKARLEDEARDQELMASFEQIRLQVESGVNVEESRFTNDAAFPEIRDALSRYGIEVGDTPPNQAAACLQSRPGPVCRDLIASLYQCLTLGPKGDVPTRRWLLAVLDAADTDAWRMQARKVAAKGDWEALEKLAREVDVRNQPPSFLLFVAYGFPVSMRSTRLELLRRIQLAYPADLWANHRLAYELWMNGRAAEAIRYYTAALALRPHNPGIYVNRGIALSDAGEVDAAIADYRQALALTPQYATAHNNLGVALGKKGLRDEAIAELREAIRCKKDFAKPHFALGYILDLQGQPDEAIAELQEAIRLKKDFAEVYFSLGNILREKVRLDDAIAEYREAIRFKKDYSEAYNNLGMALRAKGRLDEAIAEYHEAIRIKSDNTEAHNNLGNALRDRGRLDEAIAEFRETIQLDNNYASAHYNLGLALAQSGRLNDATAEFCEAIRLKPDYAEAHCNLGNALRLQGEFRKALEEVRRGHELGVRDPRWHYPSAQWVQRCEHMVELDERLPGFLEGKATVAGPAQGVELAELCYIKHLHRAAARFYEEAFDAAPNLADRLDAYRHNAACAAALAGCGQGKDAERLDAKQRASLRRQAGDWLRADLVAWSRLLDRQPNQAGSAAWATNALRRWLAEPDLAGVRGPQALAKLAETERQSWQQFWDEVAAMLTRAQAKSASVSKAAMK